MLSEREDLGSIGQAENTNTRQPRPWTKGNKAHPKKLDSQEDAEVAQQRSRLEALSKANTQLRPLPTARHSPEDRAVKYLRRAVFTLGLIVRTRSRVRKVIMSKVIHVLTAGKHGSGRWHEVLKVSKHKYSRLEQLGLDWHPKNSLQSRMAAWAT